MKKSYFMHELSRIDLVLASLIFDAGLVLYIRTLAPSLVSGDGAEFQTLAFTLGMTHPTGYPIYLLIGKLFTFIPLGNVAYRVNLLSAVLGAYSLGLLYLIAQILTGRRAAALLAPLWLGINGIFWSQAIMAEIYTAATAFTTSILLLVLLWRQNSRWPYLFVAGLLGGLGMGVHSSVLLMGPAIIIYLLLTTRAWKAWLAASCGALLGVSLTLAAYLLLSRIQIPATYYNVGLRFVAPETILSPPNLPSELNRVFFMLFAQEFKGDVFAVSGAIMLQSAGRYLDYLADWFPLAGLSVMVLGLIALFFRQWREALLLAIGLLCGLLFIFANNSYGLYVFCIPSFVLLALLFSLGVEGLEDGLTSLSNRFPDFNAGWVPQGLRLIPFLFLGAMLWWAAAPVLSSVQAGHITFMDAPDKQVKYFLQKKTYPVDKPELALTRAWIAVKALAPRAIVFSEWEELYSYFYVANVERNRSDLEVYEVCKFANQPDPREGRAILRYIEENSGARPIYFTDPAMNTCSSLITALNQHYTFDRTAGGQLWKLVPRAAK